MRRIDLYSDLPPAMSAISSQSIHDANKPSDSTNNNNNSTNNNNNNNNNNNVSTNTSVSGTKSNVSISFKPSSLQFKPRQTVASVHNNTSLNVNNKHQNHLAPLIPLLSIGDSNNNNNSSSNSDNMKSTTTASTSMYHPHPNNQNINFMSTIDNNKDEFNTNSSFDVSDPYDPKKPNDYIAYCSERLEKRRLKLLEEENKKHIEEMNKAREELELERKKAAEKGDYTFLMKSMQQQQQQQQQQQGSRGVEDVIYSTMGVNSTNHSNANTGGGMNGSGSSGVGRGRGRGALTNLPAWMVDQMKDTTTHNQNDNINNSNSSSGSISGVRQYADSNSINSSHTSASSTGNDGIIKKRLVVKGGFSKPSCILLLKNMVGADDQEELNGLAIETQQECLKYGPISSCIVYVVDINDVDNNDKKKKKYQSCPSHERVRTFICFERQDSAVRAYRDLNGRFFGGRQISASFYDEDKYARRDLAPDDVECSNFTSSTS